MLPGARGFVIANIVVALAVVGLGASPAWAQPSETYADCGEVVRGVECFFFRPDHDPGMLYQVDGNLFCPAGTRICVEGTLQPNCGGICQEGNGCILEASVTPRCHCPCDWDYSHLVSSQDLFDFLNDFFGGDADANFDGETTIQDVLDFVECFTEGWCAR